MEDALWKLAGFLLAAVLLFLIPTMALLERQDDITQSLVQAEVSRFADTARDMGAISPRLYERFTDRLASTGLRYNIRLRHEKRSWTPEYVETNGSLSFSGDFGQSRVTEGERTIIAVLFPDGTSSLDDDSRQYRMHAGDLLFVEVENRGLTMAGSLRQMIFASDDSGMGILARGGAWYGMKPISIAFLCLLAMAPFLLMSGIRADSLEKELQLRAHYDAAIDNAISDASWIMASSVRGSAGYDAGSGISADGDAAVSVFYDSLSAGLGAARDPAIEASVRAHVPVMVLVGNEGASLLVYTLCTDESGILQYKTVRLPDQPYLHVTDEGARLIRFTLGDTVEIMNQADGSSVVSSWQECRSLLSSIPNEDAFHEMRLDVVTGVVRNLLEKGLALANRQLAEIPDSAEGILPILGPSAGQLTGIPEGGKSAEIRFDLPRTDDAEFRRAVSQIGIFAYVKGLPVGGDKAYNTFAFGGGRVIRSDGVVGYEWEGQPTYCRLDCSAYSHDRSEAAFEPDTIRFFSTAREAADEGYRACPACRP